MLIIKHAFSITSPAGYIVFDGLVTGQEQGDIAIDDVSVTLGACDTVSMSLTHYTSNPITYFRWCDQLKSTWCKQHFQDEI